MTLIKKRGRIMSLYKAPRNNKEMLTLCELLGETRKYRPLPKKIKPWFYDQYLRYMNGFSGPDARTTATINGVRICGKWDRVVVGDYGAYLEFDPEDLLVVKEVPYEQRWRLDKAYLERAGLNPKYVWYTVAGVKCYHQLGTVKYADYKVGKMYIHVCEFDSLVIRGEW
jgi:hypothetical protein